MRPPLPQRDRSTDPTREQTPLLEARTSTRSAAWRTPWACKVRRPTSGAEHAALTSSATGTGRVWTTPAFGSPPPGLGLRPVEIPVVYLVIVALLTALFGARALLALAAIFFLYNWNQQKEAAMGATRPAAPADVRG